MDRPRFQKSKPERWASAWLGLPNRETGPDQEASGNVDRRLVASLARHTLNISPASLWLAYFDWVTHLQLSPSKQHELLLHAWKKCSQWEEYALSAPSSKSARPAMKARGGRHGKPGLVRARANASLPRSHRRAYAMHPVRMFYDHEVSPDYVH